MPRRKIDVWAVIRESAERRLGKPLIKTYLLLAVVGAVVVAISIAAMYRRYAIESSQPLSRSSRWAAMNHGEFVALVERCRDQRGALGVVREAGRLLEKKPPSALGQVEKLIQDWSKPVRLDRAVRLALQAVDDADDPNLPRVKELLRALLLVTGERAAEYERRRTIGERSTP